MIHIAQPFYLILLLLTPLFFAAYWVALRLRRQRIAKYGDPELVGRLMPNASTGKGWLKVTFFSIGWMLLCIGLARPQMGARLAERKSSGVEVMIALDVSNSMLAQDYTPNRLERSKLAISRLVDKLSEDRIGLVVFAGQSFVQLPITTDYVSAKIFLKTIDTQSVPVQGTALKDAIETSARSFSSQSEKSRAIILITDGEDHEGDAVEAAKSIAEEGIRVYCIGVGSPAGKPIPVSGGGLMTDRDGNTVVTKLDEDILREIAGAGNGKYVRAGNTEFGLNPIIDDIRDMDKEEFQSVVFEDFNEQFMYFIGIAAIFFILGFLVPETGSGRNFFKREDEQ